MNHNNELLQIAAGGNQDRLVELRRRVDMGEPVAYVAGFLLFRGRRFTIDKRAYITDPEASFLIDTVLEQGRKLQANFDRPLCVFDFGVGAGSLSISVKLEQPNWLVTGCDLDSQALTLASQNAQMHGVDIDFWQSDYLSNWPKDRDAPDILFSDPPWGDANDLYEDSRDEHYYQQMPVLSAFPLSGNRTGIHDILIQQIVDRQWPSLIILNYGILPYELIVKSAKPLSNWALVHPQSNFSILVGRV